jgi:hypothetical protein
VPVYAELTHVAGDLVTGELPILSQARALATIATGADPCSGEQVAGWDRAARLLDVLPGGRKLRQGGTLATASLGAFGFLRRHGDEAADAAAAAKRGAFAAPKAVSQVHQNSLDYVGDTHVYRIKGPNGTHKIGESAQGTRVRDGASIRGEQQARRLTRETGDFYESDIRKTFPDKRSAREYETQLIELFRRMFGEDVLPGNSTNRWVICPRNTIENWGCQVQP